MAPGLAVGPPWVQLGSTAANWPPHPIWQLASHGEATVNGPNKEGNSNMYHAHRRFWFAELLFIDLEIFREVRPQGITLI